MVARDLRERAGAVEHNVLEHRRQLAGDPTGDDPATDDRLGEPVADAVDEVRPRPDSAVRDRGVGRGHLHRRHRDSLADRHVSDRRA